MADEPPSLAVGTGVSAKYKGAFCEAKIRKVVRSVKCKVLFKNGLGSFTVGDDQIKGVIRTGAVVEARHPEKKEFSEATITKIQDCSQYTVVFDDGDITTLRRTALCLKSGKHFAESETLDQLPLTHPEHFSTPVIGGRRGRRTRIGASEASSDEDGSFHPSSDFSNFKETDIGRVVCVEGAEKRKNRDNWFPGLIVAPTAQESVPIRVRDEYLVRSFKDGRYYTVPKKEITDFTRELGAKAETNSLKAAVEKALQFLDRDELPLHWDRDLLLYGVTDAGSDSDPGDENESSDDEPREKKDHFVAQLYKFMDENGTPINEEPVIGSKDVDLFRLYKVVHNLGGFNRVTNQNNWKNVSVKLGFGHNPVVVGLVKQSYRKYLFSFEEWPKRPGCAMQIQPRLSRSRSRMGRGSNLKDRSCSSPTAKPENEKSEEKAIPSPSEPPSMPSTSKAISVPPKEAVTPVVKPVTAQTAKDKSTTRKTPVITASIATPVKSSTETVKVLAKEIKVEPGLKLRNPKYKPVEPEVMVVKQEIKVEKIDDSDAVEAASSVAVKEKKKRVGPRVQKKEIPMVKGGKVDCLANSRQKRVIKERLKTVAESMKARSKSSASSQDGSEKVTASKAKVKDEPAATKTHKKEKDKEETSSPVDKKFSCGGSSEDKRKGRKRKEKSETFEENYEETHIPTFKTISLGDKLKVYYGPTKEAKVTSYDAKVLSTKEENGETLYYVHYLGWNVRYDEWIRANRIAEVLGAGRSPKKQNQAPSTPKSSKKEKKSSKTENSKLESKERSKETSGPCTTTSSTSTKEHNQSRQGSVGRSTTPCSVASSSSRSKGPVQKRPKTRAAQSKKDEEIAEESESDGGSDGDEMKMDVTSTPDEPEDEAKGVKSEQSEDEGLERDGPDVETETESNDNKIVSGPKQLKPKEEPSEPMKVKTELEDESDDVEDEEMVDFEEEPEDNKEFDADDLEMLIQNSVVKEEYSDDSFGRGTPLLGFDVPSDLVKKESTCECVEDDSEKIDESDNTVSKVDGEIGEGLLPDEAKQESETEEASKSVKSESEDDCNGPNSPEPPLAPTEMETEDVYEFKEPEPFEFEVRKSDDKGKGTKRTLCSLSVEDKPSSPKSKKIAVSPARDTSSKGSYQSPTELLSKDDNSPESTPTIQTCEEAFDKICASPLRAATLDSRGIALLDNMENDEDDNFDDDSEDRLVISERDSDNCSNISSETGAPTLTKATVESARDSQPEPPEDEEVKSLDEDQEEDSDEEDEEENEADEESEGVESEALKTTEQVVESSDELSEDEAGQTLPANAPVASDETAQDKEETDPKKPENEETVTVMEVDSKPDDSETDAETTEKEIDSNQDVPKLEPDLAISKEEVTKTEQNPEIPQEDSSLIKEVKPVEEVAKSEPVDAEEDENNLESLICEETIPGSPPSHLDVLCQIEDKSRQNDDVGLFKSDSDVVSKSLLNNQDNKLATQVVRVGRSPSTTPESNESSTLSPLREPVSSLVPCEKQPEKDTGAVSEGAVPSEPSTLKKEPGKPSTDGRAKKVEPKPPAKRGRKSKKKTDDSSATTRRKYGRHTKHQGSESDDGYDLGGNRSDSSGSHHPYRKNFLIPAEELAAMDVGQRIARLTQAMQDLRTAYNNHKAELAAVDKRRKRIRRREREDAARITNARSH